MTCGFRFEYDRRTPGRAAAIKRALLNLPVIKSPQAVEIIDNKELPPSSAELSKLNLQFFFKSFGTSDDEAAKIAKIAPAIEEPAFKSALKALCTEGFSNIMSTMEQRAEPGCLRSNGILVLTPRSGQEVTAKWLGEQAYDLIRDCRTTKSDRCCRPGHCRYSPKI